MSPYLTKMYVSALFLVIGYSAVAQVIGPSVPPPPPPTPPPPPGLPLPIDTHIIILVILGVILGIYAITRLQKMQQS